MTGIGYPMSMENAVMPFNGDPRKPLQWLHIGPSGCTRGVCGGEQYFTPYVAPTKEDPRDKLIEHYERLVVRLEKEVERLEATMRGNRISLNTDLSSINQYSYKLYPITG